MKCLLVVGLLMVASILIEPVYPYCSRGMLNTNVLDNGLIEQYCDGPKGKMNVGDKVRHNCEDCHCDPSGMSCCTVGYKAGAFSVPDCEMKPETDTCCYQFFQINDPTKSCTDKECPPAL